jgi:CRP/FNR family transcriptional regulator
MAQSDAVSEAAGVLAAVPAFAGLDAPTLADVARMATRQHYDANQVVFLEGDSAAGLYVVQHGWLKAVKLSSTGREQTLRVVGPGEVFNDLSVLVGAPNPATVIALEPATVWNIPHVTLLRLLDTHPSMARVVIQNLAERILHLLNLIEDLSLRTVEARLARLLLTQATADVVQRRRWTTQAELAARLGTVPDVLSRALRNLVEAGLIQVERHQIRILDRPGLESSAQLD